MRFDASQQMRLGQQMKLAPRMIQSMEVLQMSLTELEERIEQELESNAALERIEGAPAEAGAEADPDQTPAGSAVGDADSRPEQAEEIEPTLRIDETGSPAEFERLEEFQETQPDAADNEFTPSSPERDEPTSYSASRMDGERDAKLDAMSAAPARAESLNDQLLAQWALCDVEESLRRPGELIIAFLDGDGYLRTPLDAIVDRTPEPKPALADLERALKAVQLMIEPAGTAARDTRECLLLQLDAVEDELSELPPEDLRRARALIESHIDDLLQNRLPRVAEKTGFSLDEIKSAMRVMKHLSLAPARRLVDEREPPITPDAIVEYDADSDRYIAYLNERRVPSLRVNQEYARMARDRGVPQKDREFLRTSVGNAQWLIDAVHQRQHTLLRVLKVVVAAQRDYFDYGPQALKPLPMTQVAEQLGIHVATVSRAVAEKYVLTPRGVVPLRKFFTGGTQNDSGEDVSWDAIKDALREVIAAEDKSKPLSDEALVEKLKERGLDIARRTVAKYRDQLSIPPARLRKSY